MPTFACDVSYFQAPVNDSYPHDWLIFRVCDGNFRDPNFSKNYTWARKAARTGKIAGYTVYCVYRPGVDTFGTVVDMLAGIDGHVTVMVDVESWGGAIRGDHSKQITALAQKLATFLGSRQRVLAYGNQGDLANLYPHRPDWLRLVVASYGTQRPNVRNLIGWQYSDGATRWPVPDGYPRASRPFGHCDHNVFPGLTPAQLATALGVGKPTGGTGTSPDSKPRPSPHPQEDSLSAAEVAEIKAAIAAEGHKTRQRINDMFTVQRDGQLHPLANQLMHFVGEPEIPFDKPTEGKHAK